MNGTKWTEQGKGATRQELAEALGDAIGRTNMAKRDRDNAEKILSAYLCPENYSRTSELTNLALTGRPLTPYDVRRIAEAWGQTIRTVLAFEDEEYELRPAVKRES